MCRNDAFDPGDDSEPGDGVGAKVLIGSPGGQSRQLEEGRVAVDQQLDPLADEQLAPGPMAIDVLLAAP